MIHLGTWQDAAWPEQVDCIITDPPYSERTHSGNNGGRREKRDPSRDPAKKCPSGSKPIRQIDYTSLSPADVQAWAKAWAPRVRYWIAVMCDHSLIPTWSAALSAAGLYTFAPVPCVITGMTCRLTGDGPSSWAVYLVVARTKAASKWGTLPGAYVVGQSGVGNNGKDARIGGKPLPLMQQIVRDYSRPGMLVADPCAGHATTLVAALQAGRRVWGAECDPAAHAAAVARLERVTAQPQLITETIQPELL
jgi:site-specific DNA-methyltransferase (adenine-specific)